MDRRDPDICAKPTTDGTLAACRMASGFPDPVTLHLSVPRLVPGVTVGVVLRSSRSCMSLSTNWLRSP